MRRASVRRKPGGTPFAQCRSPIHSRFLTGPELHRVHQFVLIASLLVFSWLAMQAVHELGHVLHAWASGGTVTRVLLDPLEISRTDVAPNPHPQFVAWGGPIWGALLPAAAWFALHAARLSRAWLARFFAGFCLIANGAYLLGGSIFPAGDAEVLLREGAPRWALAAFGIASAGAGLWLWNGSGAHFGLARSSPAIDKKAAWGAALAAAALAIAEWVACR